MGYGRSIERLECPTVLTFLPAGPTARVTITSTLPLGSMKPFSGLALYRPGLDGVA